MADDATPQGEVHRCTSTAIAIATTVHWQPRSGRVLAKAHSTTYVHRSSREPGEEPDEVELVHCSPLAMFHFARAVRYEEAGDREAEDWAMVHVWALK